MKFNIRLFMGDREVTREDLKKYAIRSNTVDRIVNSVVDRAVITEEGKVIFAEPKSNNITA